MMARRCAGSTSAAPAGGLGSFVVGDLPASSAAPVPPSTLPSPAPASSGSEGIPLAFHRSVKVAQRNACGRRADSREFDYLRDELARRTLERFLDVKRSFPSALDLGANSGNVLRALRGHGGIERLHMLDSAEALLRRDEGEWPALAAAGGLAPGAVSASVRAEEAPLPFADGALDAVISSCSLHWQNDLPGVFREALRVLRPDGVFLGNMLGGQTLQELRSAFVEAETAEYGGVSPHVSPMVGVPDVGNLLSGCGFGLPTVDADTFSIEYPSARALMRHLQAMGEGNACVHMRQGARRRLFERAEATYAQHFGNADGSVTATFQAIFFIGWKPAPSQPRPLRRGSVQRGFGARGLGPPPSLVAAMEDGDAAAREGGSAGAEEKPK